MKVGKENIQFILDNIDDGRFKKLFEVIKVEPRCLDCFHFNHTLSRAQSYRCKCAPRCIGATLDASLISYILWQLGLKTQEEHYHFIGI